MAKLDKKTRDSLKDSDFGIPSKRMYPIHDKAHVEAAVKLFGHASNEDKPELAHNILRKAKEFGMDSSGWTQINEWAKKYKGKNTNESADEVSDETVVDSVSNDEDEYEDLTDGITEAAAGASLLTVKNQLMRMVGDAFKFIGGSLVPKFTMQSTEKPQVSFDVNAVGQNVEVTPKYNGTPDTMHKRKGIAFMRAADTIANFVQDVVNRFSGTPATAMESVNYYDEYFEALLEYADELMDECELEAYLDENPDMGFAICIGEDYLYDDDDFNAYFEGTEYDGDDRDIIIESDLFTETAHPYDDYLRLHQYDPKTNTIVINGKRVDAGPKGSKKQRNRLNKFLRENGYDPKTGTIATNIPDGQGGFKRVPFDIGVSYMAVGGEGSTEEDFSKPHSLERDMPAFTRKRLNNPDQDSFEAIGNDINTALADIPVEEVVGAIQQIESRIKNGKTTVEEVRAQGPIYRLSNGQNVSYDDLKQMQQKIIKTGDSIFNDRTSQAVAMRKKLLMDNPRNSNLIFGHELGHIRNGDQGVAGIAGSSMDMPESSYTDFLAQSPIGQLNAHGQSPAEYRADEYGKKFAQQRGHAGRYGNEIGTALIRPVLDTGHAVLDSYKREKKQLAEKREELRQQLLTKQISAADYASEIREIANDEQEIDAEIAAVREQIRSGNIPVDQENELAARSAYAAMNTTNERRSQERDAHYRRRLLREQLQQQIDSGQLTPKQIQQAKKRIARIDQFDRNSTPGALIDPKTGRAITHTQATSKSGAKRLARAKKYDDINNAIANDIIAPYQYYQRTGEVPEEMKRATLNKRESDTRARLEQFDTDDLREMISSLENSIKFAQTMMVDYPDDSAQYAAAIIEYKKQLELIKKIIRERTGQAASKKTKSSSSSETPKKKRTGTKVTEREIPDEDAKKKPASKKTSGTSSAAIAKTSAPKKKPEEASAKSEPKKKEAAPEKKPIEKNPAPAKPVSAKNSETKPEETKK